MTGQIQDHARPVTWAPAAQPGDLDGLDWVIALAAARVFKVDAELVPETLAQLRTTISETMREIEPKLDDAEINRRAEVVLDAVVEHLAVLSGSPAGSA